MSKETDAAHRVVMDFLQITTRKLNRNLIVTFTFFNFKEIQILIDQDQENKLLSLSYSIKYVVLAFCKDNFNFGYQDFVV